MSTLAELEKRAAKTLPDHKGKVLFGAAYSCSCGWTSAVFFGKGARGNAAYDFHSHKMNCLKAEEIGQ